MRPRNLDPEGLKRYYRERNLLKAKVLADHVGNAVVFFASTLTHTTGATLPVDGGVAAGLPTLKQFSCFSFPGLPANFAIPSPAVI